MAQALRVCGEGEADLIDALWPGWGKAWRAVSSTKVKGGDKMPKRIGAREVWAYTVVVRNSPLGWRWSISQVCRDGRGFLRAYLSDNLYSESWEAARDGARAVQMAADDKWIEVKRKYFLKRKGL